MMHRARGSCTYNPVSIFTFSVLHTMESSSSSSSLAEWSSSFLAFLRDSQYDGPDTKMKVSNLTNIFNLLFVPGQRHKDVGDPPAPDDLIHYMVTQGLLEKEGEFLRVAQTS